MTRPKLILGVLAAACVGTLLWYAWLIVAVDLPRGATIATWALWLVSAAAVLTLIAYVREFLAHRQAAGREASWRPLPGLVLLWIGGLTAMVSFAFILPDKAAIHAAADPATAGTSLSAQTVEGASASAAGSARSRTAVSRSGMSRTTPPAPVSTAPGSPSPTGAASRSSTSRAAATSTGASARPTRPESTTSTAATSTPATSTPSTTTSTPLIDLTLPTPPTR